MISPLVPLVIVILPELFVLESVVNSKSCAPLEVNSAAAEPVPITTSPVPLGTN